MDYRRDRNTGKIDINSLSVPNDPPTITNTAAVWWADDLQLNDTDPVSSWVDRVNSKVISQTGSARPTYDENGIGSKPSVNFDGADDLLELGNALTSSNEGCIVAVTKIVESNPNTKCIWSACADNSHEQYLMGRLGYPTINKFGIQYDGNGDPDHTVLGNSPLTNDDVVMEWSTNGVSWGLRLNNTLETLNVEDGVNSGSWFGDVGSMNEFVVGAERFRSGSLYTIGHLNFRLAYLGVYSSELSSGDRTDLYNWISDYYGITMS